MFDGLKQSHRGCTNDWNTILRCFIEKDLYKVQMDSALPVWFHTSLALTDIAYNSLASDKYFIYIDKVKICNPFSEQLTRVLSWKPERQ